MRVSVGAVQHPVAADSTDLAVVRQGLAQQKRVQESSRDVRKESAGEEDCACQKAQAEGGENAEGAGRGADARSRRVRALERGGRRALPQWRLARGSQKVGRGSREESEQCGAVHQQSLSLHSAAGVSLCCPRVRQSFGQRQKQSRCDQPQRHLPLGSQGVAQGEEMLQQSA